MQGQTQPSFGAPPSAPPRNRPIWAPILACCGVGCAVLLVIAIAGIVAGWRSGSGLTKNGDQTARQFMQEVQANQLDKAYASTSSAWRRSSSLADFKAFATMWRQQQGDLKRADLRSSSWYTGTGGSTATLVYTVTGNRHNGVVTIVVVSEGGHLAVQSCNFTPQASAGDSGSR
jgi:hypothetical protein